MAKTACYVDGFNLYHAIDALQRPYLKWVNLMALSLDLTAGDELVSVVYFSAYMQWDQTKMRRHREFVSALETVGVEPVMAKFQGVTKYCGKSEQYCNFKEEKQTDVGFAARVLCDVFMGGLERIVLLTADSDQIPTVAAVRGLAPDVRVSIAAPPDRKNIARELAAVAHDCTEISAGRLERCIFPRNVLDSRGRVAARCPARYARPRNANEVPETH